jgi:hypothetical protein
MVEPEVTLIDEALLYAAIVPPPLKEIVPLPPLFSVWALDAATATVSLPAVTMIASPTPMDTVEPE